MVALPNARLVTAGVPVTWAKGSDAVGADGLCTRYDRPAVTGTLSVAAVVGATTEAPVEPSTTSACWPGHGLRTVIVRVAPASIAAVVRVPPTTCTSTLEPPCTYTVPETSQPEGQ